MKTVLEKIRIDFGKGLGNSKLLLTLVSALKPALAAFVAVTTQIVLEVVLNTNVVGSIEHPEPFTAKVTAPVPEPPELLRINLIDDEEILSSPMTVSGVRGGVVLATTLGICGAVRMATRRVRLASRAAH